MPAFKSDVLWGVGGVLNSGSLLMWKQNGSIPVYLHFYIIGILS